MKEYLDVFSCMQLILKLEDLKNHLNLVRSGVVRRFSLPHSQVYKDCCFLVALCVVIYCVSVSISVLLTWLVHFFFFFRFILNGKSCLFSLILSLFRVRLSFLFSVSCEDQIDRIHLRSSIMNETQTSTEEDFSPGYRYCTF